MNFVLSKVNNFLYILLSKVKICRCVSWCEKSDVTQKSAVRNTPNTKYLQNCPNLVYLCTKFRTHMKINLQLITASVLSVGGLILLFCGVFIDPEGQIHETLLVAFGEVATFSGALMGVDYVYRKRNNHNNGTERS